MNAVKKIYQMLFSEKIREDLSRIRSIPKNYILKKKVIHSIKNDVDYAENCEKKEIVAFLKKHSLRAFPYQYTSKYDNLNDIQVHEDADGYKYFVYQGKKIYGKKKWTVVDFQKYFQMIMIEQDPQSAHCYFSRNENRPKEEDIVADIGTAEGWFALQVVDTVKKIYCFEADTDWIEPLKRTIAPYKDKIELIESFVGGVSENTISLDDFFVGKKITFIKADIEGFEKEMLENAQKTFVTKIKKALLVMYHNQEDEIMISKIMESYGFRGIFNKGYILLFFSPGFKPPYIRRGVVCYEKK